MVAYGRTTCANTADYEYVFYRGTDSHVHELYRNGTYWPHVDISAKAGSANAAGDPAVFLVSSDSSPASPRVVYRASNNHVYHLYPSSSTWGYSELTTLTKAPNAAGEPFGFAEATIMWCSGPATATSTNSTGMGPGAIPTSPP